MMRFLTPIGQAPGFKRRMMRMLVDCATIAATAMAVAALLGSEATDQAIAEINRRLAEITERLDIANQHLSKVSGEANGQSSVRPLDGLPIKGRPDHLGSVALAAADPPDAGGEPARTARQAEQRPRHGKRSRRPAHPPAQQTPPPGASASNLVFDPLAPGLPTDSNRDFVVQDSR